MLHEWSLYFQPCMQYILELSLHIKICFSLFCKMKGKNRVSCTCKKHKKQANNKRVRLKSAWIIHTTFLHKQCKIKIQISRCTCIARVPVKHQINTFFKRQFIFSFNNTIFSKTGSIYRSERYFCTITKYVTILRIFLIKNVQLSTPQLKKPRVFALKF